MKYQENTRRRVRALEARPFALSAQVKIST
jgi:hypothetical protein